MKVGEHTNFDEGALSDIDALARGLFEEHASQPWETALTGSLAIAVDDGGFEARSAIDCGIQSQLKGDISIPDGAIVFKSTETEELSGDRVPVRYAEQWVALPSGRVAKVTIRHELGDIDSDECISDLDGLVLYPDLGAAEGAIRAQAERDLLDLQSKMNSVRRVRDDDMDRLNKIRRAA